MREYLAGIWYAGQQLDEALRDWLEVVWLQGEAQKMQRMLSVFAAHFYTQNPSVFMNQGAADTMAFATIMLNTNLHNPKVPSLDTMLLLSYLTDLTLQAGLAASHSVWSYCHLQQCCQHSTYCLSAVAKEDSFLAVAKEDSFLAA